MGIELAGSSLLLGGCSGVFPKSVLQVPADPLVIEVDRVATARSDARAPQPRQDPQPASTGWGEGDGRSYVVPAFDILTFQLLLNQFNRYTTSEGDYDSDFDSIRRNLKHNWVIDRDPFAVNQFLHPYQGATYHAFARSAGLGYWESLIYDCVGSAIWEVAGEVVPPSLNDQITTTIGGSYLGEALYRTASVLLGGGSGRPGFFAEAGAAAISPAMGFNRLAFGDRFDAVESTRGAPVYGRIGIGARHNSRQTDLGILADLTDNSFEANFAIDYGVPGKVGYDHERPFDYFHFEGTGTSSASALPENLLVTGLLGGVDYEAGDWRGVVGAFGTYDYLAPEVFSLSSTALQLGTVGQLAATPDVAVQGIALAGVGWGAGGAIADADVDRNYHYGLCPQGQVGFVVIGGTRVRLEATGNVYYLDGTGTAARAGYELVTRARVALAFRIYDRHALTIQYVASTRDARYDNPLIADTQQEVGAISLYYTLLGGPGPGLGRSE
ncbi:MAG: DUF3943 domain-containing protein [Planctomycetes bacterium]|nr:DUF3943 domain-containing protein [Planctomycetota bacterium]